MLTPTTQTSIYQRSRARDDTCGQTAETMTPSGTYNLPELTVDMRVEIECTGPAWNYDETINVHANDTDLGNSGFTADLTVEGNKPESIGRLIFEGTTTGGWRVTGS